MVLWLTAVGLPGACHGVFIHGYEPRLHDRYYEGPDRAFIGENQPWSRPDDWSGIGRDKDPHILLPSGEPYISYWFNALVSDHFFLMAHHVGASRHYDGEQGPFPVRYYRNGDRNGEYWDGMIELLPGNFEYTNYRVPGVDLKLYRLTEAPPDWVRRYPLMKRPLDVNWVSFIDPTVYVAGVGESRYRYDTMRLGRNTINESIGGFITYDPDSPPGLGADETNFHGGDSSSPTFAITPAGPTLFSINTGFVSTMAMPEWHEAIQAILQAQGEQADIVTDLLGDLDADFDVDEADAGILETHFGAAEGVSYVRGDLNRDNAIDELDRTIMTAQLGRLLRAPADFNLNQTIDSDDFAVIAANWTQAVAPGTLGDASGDGLVDRADILVLDANRMGPLLGEPVRQFAGDADFDGLVSNSDLELWAANLGRDDIEAPYYTNGDVTGDHLVDHADLVVIRDHYGRLFGDVDGDSRVGLTDLDAIIAQLGASAEELAALDLDASGSIDTADLAAAGAFLGSTFRRPLPSRIAGIIPGDFNGDMYIDGSDLLVWQRTYGSMSALAADANDDGVVDDLDMAIWQANFEFNMPAEGEPGGLAPTPEPGALTLAATAAGVGLAGGRRRRGAVAKSWSKGALRRWRKQQ